MMLWPVVKRKSSPSLYFYHFENFMSSIREL